MIERQEFDHLVRDALTNLYDTAALEVHSLASLFPRTPGDQASRAQHLRQLLLDAIAGLRPPGPEPSREAVEWRPYLVLYGRYVEGVSLPVFKPVSRSARASSAASMGAPYRPSQRLLWDQMQNTPALSARTDAGERAEDADAWGSSPRTFEISRESLELDEVVRGVAGILARRVSGEGAALALDLGADLPHVQADRVILRQILLSLIHYALQARADSDISLHTEALDDQVALDIRFRAVASVPLVLQEEEALEPALYWVQRLDGALEWTGPTSEAKTTCLRLSLPRARESLILVVDDQEAAIRMFGRYLSRADVRVIGVREPEQVLSLARNLAPAAITLDVMMPTMDGWEILQSLKADPETRDIPVIVCSVWDEPELADSLGAARFLKKPITQRDLWDVLVELRVLDRSAESSPANT